MSHFDKAILKVLEHEGGYQNNPKDRGNWTTGKVGEGENKGTKFGIAAMVYPTLDIKNLTKEQAMAIYRRDYWRSYMDKIISYPVAAKFFDMCVNMGHGQAIKLLQRAADVTDDGVVGPKTLAAVNAKADMLDALVREQKEFYANLVNNKPQMAVFFKGWMRRANWEPEGVA